MIITFCGHSNCLFSEEVKEQLKNILVCKIIKNPTCKFYLGGYGDFDSGSQLKVAITSLSVRLKIK